MIEGEVEDGKRYTEADFNRTIEIREREQYRVRTFMDMIDQREKTIVFCATQEHALMVRDIINQMSTSTNPNHVLAMMEQAMDHDGFSFVQILSECVEFYPGAFDNANPRKGGAFVEVPKEHDVTDEYASYRLAEDLTPGKFGVIYKTTRPTKNANEAQIIADHQAKTAGLEPWQILKKNFDRMK